MHLLASFLMLASFILLIVGLAGNWWHGGLDLAVVSGTGYFSLWNFDAGVNILNVVSIPTSQSIDSMCGGSFQETTVGNEICSKIVGIRVLIFIALFSALFAATGFVLLSLGLTKERNFSRSKYGRILRISAAFWTLADVTCTIIGLSLAASMPFSKEAQKLGVAGGGVICTIVQLGLCTITLALQLCSCCEVGSAFLHEVEDGKATEHADERKNAPVVVAEVVNTSSEQGISDEV